MQKAVRNLASAVLLQAARDYCDKDAIKEEKAHILKDLKSDWMDFLTSGLSKTVAKELQLNERGIRKRLRIQEEKELRRN